MDVVDVLSEIHETLREIRDSYKDNLKSVGKYDAEVTDLLHLIEFGKHDAVRMIKIYKDIENIRVNRRACKDSNLKMKPVYTLLDEKYPKFLDDLRNCIKEIRKTCGWIDRRKYVPRIRSDPEFNLATIDDLKNKWSGCDGSRDSRA